MQGDWGVFIKDLLLQTGVKVGNGGINRGNAADDFNGIFEFFAGILSATMIRFYPWVCREAPQRLPSTWIEHASFHLHRLQPNRLRVLRLDRVTTSSAWHSVIRKSPATVNVRATGVYSKIDFRVGTLSSPVRVHVGIPPCRNVTGFLTAGFFETVVTISYSNTLKQPVLFKLGSRNLTGR